MDNNTGLHFLFSIDLEDPRENVDRGFDYKDAVESNCLLFLKWLDINNVKCTFFVVGKIAERYPDLIILIHERGHEIACHSHTHSPLCEMGEYEFQKDLEKNINAIEKCIAVSPMGYRAPTFSLTKDATWAYGILNKFGIKYSSSVLPAKSPLFGFEDFGRNIRIVDGVTEIPISVSRIGPLTIPIAGGLYLRVIPKFLLMRNIKRFATLREPLVSYIHPYDCDINQEYFLHEHVKNHFVNALMYYNRRNIFDRLDSIVKLGFSIVTYQNYLTNSFGEVK